MIRDKEMQHDLAVRSTPDVVVGENFRFDSTPSVVSGFFFCHGRNEGSFQGPGALSKAQLLTGTLDIKEAFHHGVGEARELCLVVCWSSQSQFLVLGVYAADTSVSYPSFSLSRMTVAVEWPIKQIVISFSLGDGLRDRVRLYN